MKLFEEQLKRTKEYSGRLIDVYTDEILIHQNNATALREVVDHPGGVCVAARTHENKYLMVRQYRYAQQAVGLEFIAGKKEPSEDPFIGIQRELLEEGGAVAQTWYELGETFPSPAYLNEKIHLYLATDLEMNQQQLEENEFVVLEEYTIDEIINRIQSNEIQDLKTIALAYMLKSIEADPRYKSLKTENLLLRRVNNNDIEDINNNFKGDILKYLYPTQHKDIQETTKIVNHFKQHSPQSDYVYAITKDSKFIGLCGIHGLKNEFVELGIWTIPDVHGHHYGREAIGALLDFGSSLGIYIYHYPVDHRNIPSVKIPLYFGGKIVKDIEKETTADSRELEIVTYEIKTK